MPVKTKIQVRRDTAANWTSTNPTLAAGEQGWETDTKRMKVGDGTTAWTSLAYFAPTAKIAHESNTTVTVSNTTTETNLLSFSQAAASNDCVYRIVAAGVISQSSGANVNYTFRFKIGSTTVGATAAIAVASDVQNYGWRAAIDVVLDGAKTSQKTTGDVGWSRGGSAWYSAQAGNIYRLYNASTEDMTTAKTIALSVQMGTASANASITCQTFFVEEITK